MCWKHGGTIIIFFLNVYLCMLKGMQVLLWAFVLLEARGGRLVSSSIPCAQKGCR